MYRHIATRTQQVLVNSVVENTQNSYLSKSKSITIKKKNTLVAVKVLKVSDI